jgi:5'-nucleotidase
VSPRGRSCGIEAIGGELAAVRQQNPNTLFVGGGDLIGASPVTSSLLRDEPSVIAMSKLGMKASALGNHEFDQGLKELLRMQNGGCDSNAPDKACKFEANYPGASFKWLGANVQYTADGTNPFQPYDIETIGGARIGFIGAVLRDTPTIVNPTGVAGLTFLDEAASINKYVPVLKAQKVDAIIVLIHQGGDIKAGSAAKFNTDACQDLEGDIVPIAMKIDPAVSAIISGHTHQGYNCVIPDPNGKPRVVIQGEISGHLLQRLDLVVDTANHTVQQVRAQNVLIDYNSRKANGTLDSSMTALLGVAKSKTDEVKNQFVANLGVPQILRGPGNTESALGDVIADSQLAATKAQGAQIAFMNPGGIRADLPSGTNVKAGNAVNFGDVFTVQPFGNTMVVMDLTGAQIKALLEQQASGKNADTNVKVLQVSAGFTYSLNLSAADGARVSNVKLNGQALDDTATYRVALNSFLSTGGDNFTVFKDGKNVVQLPNLVDVDALVAYLKASGAALTGAVQNRITITK